MATSLPTKPLIDPFDHHLYIGSSLEYYYKTFFIKSKFSELGLSVKLKYEPSNINSSTLSNVHEGITRSFRCLLFVNDSYFSDIFCNEEKSRLLQKCKMFTNKAALILMSSSMDKLSEARKMFEDFEQLLISDDDLTNDTFYNDIIISLLDDTNLNLIHLPKENIGHEAAYGYFYGFLRLVLPDLSNKPFGDQEQMDQKMISKMLIIIPEDCICSVNFNILNKLETTKMFLSTIANRAGTMERNYKSSIHKIIDEKGNDYYFVGEFATPLLSMYETYYFGLSGITLEQLYQERNVFYMTLKSILNHELNSNVKDKYKLLFWRNINSDNANTELSLYKLILKAVKEEISQKSEDWVLEQDSCKDVEILNKHTQKLRIEGSFSQGVCKSLQSYDLSQKIRGKCLTLIFKECFDEPVRLGCEHDKNYINETFGKLRFEVEIFEDQTNCELETLLLKYQKMDHSLYGAFICCISSHGRYGNIITKDGVMPILKITEFFSETSCPSLKDKPKMFFIQCCQKDQPNIKEKILEPSNSSENATQLSNLIKSFLNLPEVDNSNPILHSKLMCLIRDESNEKVTQIIRYESLIKSALTPGHPNFLMSYSCLPSKASYRTKNIGSIYFKALQKCIIKNVDINTCLVNVTQEVNLMMKSFQKKTGKSDVTQEPFFVSSGLKKLIYFD